MNDEPLISSLHFQNHLEFIKDWYTKWRFKINHSKSTHTTFTLKLVFLPELIINEVQMSSTPTFKHLNTLV